MGLIVRKEVAGYIAMSRAWISKKKKQNPKKKIRGTMKFSRDTIYYGKRIGDATEVELKRFISYWDGRRMGKVTFYEPEKVRYINETINTL